MFNTYLMICVLYKVKMYTRRQQNHKVFIQSKWSKIIFKSIQKTLLKRLRLQHFVITCVHIYLRMEFIIPKRKHIIFYTIE